MQTSLYSLKPRFQALLLPIRDLLVDRGIGPNKITLIACGLCIIYAALIAWPLSSKVALLIMPLFLLFRMALNALDGMVASFTENKSALGSVLNEVCDVISDLALFSAFWVVLPTSHFLWVLLIAVGMLTEFVSLAVFQAISFRSHSGPFGKSDRALFLGFLALLLVFFSGELWLIQSYIILGLILAVLTILNRLKTLN